MTIEPIKYQRGKHLLTIIHQLLKSKQGPTAIRYSIYLLLLVICFNLFNVLNSFVGRDFISSIEQKNEVEFYQFALLYGLLFLLSAGIGSIYRFMEERLGILWREQLTWRLTGSYLSERTYHNILNQKGIENPDQRITDDVKAFTTTTLSFLLLFLGGVFSAISFAGVLWSINPILFLVAVLYALIGTISTIFLGKELIRLNYNQLDLEANYRSDLLHIKQHAESIAVTHRELRMSVRLKSKLKKLVTNFKKLISVNLRLSLFTNSYNYFIQIIPMLIIAPSYMRGEIEFGVITQAGLAFTTLLNAFSLIVSQFQSISAFTAVVKRIQTLDTAMVHSENTNKNKEKLNYHSDEIQFENFSIYSGDKSKFILDHLNLIIKTKERWLITANDEETKLSFFRALAGISNHQEGKILKPSRDEILFLPEQPYLPPGRLRNVIVPAFLGNSVSDFQVMKELKNHNLDTLVKRLGGLSALKEWDDELSLAEKFRISTIRIQFAKPKFVVIDRPTSSVGKFEISKILKKFHNLGITSIVLAKGEETALEYDYHLNLTHFGKWSVNRMSPFLKEA
ncbi:Permease and ATP-binding protein of an ABC transporter complex [Leptospira biflexa serovar Patoc strain 'Patoc 1 (Ames)']|uniref:ABC-type transport system, permease and ATPase putative membrane protein n=1 Tax=Leptospira biflexa serovar Patoc (strain Patoc 1 / ATCC 23582 / Paris) TaxID=456481 RepID=B0SL02_LEPBP|nr:SbmA/BacA-like family transporter [Leptospira biflexa]ABZ94826.1 Permease and ATP-binding protein of an ABC transporter complex [Leptospira biflexa serovar Patoc strain 'Patoc 1 (Ames)']ABZ98495.1 ABC-type transport system, permease and ATPase; putative membrane protein [Leptospira biflexa serovar Patoc strain 'Patoc 1 (Paris)']